MILVIDHYDSFVETLARYVREAGFDTRIINQDMMGAPEIAALGSPRPLFFHRAPAGPIQPASACP